MSLYHYQDNKLLSQTTNRITDFPSCRLLWLDITQSLNSKYLMVLPLLGKNKQVSVLLHKHLSLSPSAASEWRDPFSYATDNSCIFKSAMRTIFPIFSRIFTSYKILLKKISQGIITPSGLKA